MKRTLWAAILLCALAFAMWPQKPTSPADLQVVVTKWLDSAACARSTGAILALCRDGKLVPIAVESPGDDPGHALAVDLYAAATGKVVTLDTLLALNALINFAGAATLTLLLLNLRLMISAVLVAISAPAIAGQFHDFGPHAAQMGGACLAAILPITLLGFPIDLARRSLLWICVGAICLALAATLRQSIGLMGLAASAIAIGIGPRKHPRALVACGALLIVAITSYETPTLILRLRDAVYDLSSAGLMQRHGIWHNLYIGLGTDPNPFGIQWLDSAGYAVASKVNPGVGWATQAYYDTMRAEYFRLLADHPVDIANIYANKLRITLTSEFPHPFAWLVLWLALLVIPALFAVTGWKAARNVIAIQVVSALFVCFFIGQAVLFHYRMLYLYPIQLFLVMAIGICIDAEIARYVARRAG